MYCGGGGARELKDVTFAAKRPLLWLGLGHMAQSFAKSEYMQLQDNVGGGRAL